jgi:hypothetical protein
MAYHGDTSTQVFTRGAYKEAIKVEWDLVRETRTEAAVVGSEVGE